MHAFLTFAAAAASLALADGTMDSSSVGIDISKIPQCALQCVVAAAGTTSCSVTDTYCLCTTGAEDIVKSLIPCVCGSTCTPDEVTETLKISNGICVAAFAAKGEKFDPPSPDPQLCEKAAAGQLPTPASGPASDMSSGTGPEAPPSSSPAGYAANTDMTPSATSKNDMNMTDSEMANMTNTTSGMGSMETGHNATNASGPAQSTGGAASVEAGMRMVGTALVIGLVGAALATL